jgi:3-dehydroshikimate dehydratase
MIHSGLVSITFRKLTPEAIVALITRAGLVGVEWGGDVHVPHGNLKRARAVREVTLGAGLTIPSYGSYYRVGDQTPCPFETVLETAVELDAPVIRVWAGTRGSAQADAAYRDAVVRDAHRIADLAAAAGRRVACEFHGGTLTDSNASARRLLDDVAHPALGCYWQPRTGTTLAEQLAGIDLLGTQLAHIHVFQWHLPEPPATGYVRDPLADGEATWPACLARIAAGGRDHYAMLEYVPDDTPDEFLRDAATLKKWLENLWTTK